MSKKRKHISENIFCELADIIAAGKIKKVKLTTEQEIGKQHLINCSRCRKEMGTLVRILHQDKVKDSFYDKEGNIVEESSTFLF